MIKKINNSIRWVPSYLVSSLQRPTIPLQHLFFTVCDHFEPYWNKVDMYTAQNRINRWLDEYPKIADEFQDSDGCNFVYSFFYPSEEYTFRDMKKISEICRLGLGEVEIHLHHDNDTPDNLRNTLSTFKKQLAYDHGLLSRNILTKDISYAFIHGNWALNNSRPDNKHCGVDNELDILRETGCFADMTMPSAPDITQTRTVNSIYYALDNPGASKSHNTGLKATFGMKREGLLMVQGPLSLNFKKRSNFLFPRIENGGLMANNPPSMDRIEDWIKCRVHVAGLPEWGFVKIYTHGTQESNIKMLFDDGHLYRMLTNLKEWAKASNCALHFVSAREMVNIVYAIEDGISHYTKELRDYRFVKII